MTFLQDMLWALAALLLPFAIVMGAMGAGFLLIFTLIGGLAPLLNRLIGKGARHDETDVG